MADPALAAAAPKPPRTVPLPALRQLSWPRVAPVDLATEFPWLILHQRVADEWAARADAEQHAGDDSDGSDAPPDAAATADDSDDDDDWLRSPASPARKLAPGRSVYAQPLRAPRSPPPAWSPAQRAARKMLQLQDAMDRRDDKARLRTQAAAALSTAPALSLAKAPVAVTAATTPTKPHRATKRAGTVAAVATPQARLQQWLAQQPQQQLDPVAETACSSEMATRIYAKTHATLGAGLWADEVASRLAAELSSESVFGGHVATRRLAFPSSPPPPEQPQNADETPSTTPTLASTHTPESTSTPIAPTSTTTAAGTAADVAPGSDHDTVHVHTQFPSTTKLPPPAAAATASLVAQFAADVREEAHALVCEGHVGDALATLQRGIDRVLRDFQDNADALRGRAGFDYSALAHAMARRLQRAYRRRHALRLRSLARLQRVWRRSRARRVAAQQRAWLSSAARAIQRPYKRHFERCRRERSAARIQRCFRVFQSQKLLVWLHRACRLLSTEQRRQRELVAARKRRRRRLWARLVVVARLLQLVARRRRHVAIVQAQWRGRRARQAYALVLAAAEDREARRSAREDAFVAPRLAYWRTHLRRFYSDTARGRALVGWRLRAPWLRWRRLRATGVTTNADAAAALRAMFAQRDGDREVVLRGLEARCAGVVLGRSAPSSPLGPRLVVRDAHDTSTSETMAPAIVHVHAGVHTADGAPRTHQSGGPLRRWALRLSTRWTQQRAQWAAHWSERREAAARSLHAALWTLAVYPALQVATSTLFRARRRHARDAATAALMDGHDRVARALLRRVFRAQDAAQRPPPFVCAWCGAGAATARLFFAHRNAPATGCVALEWQAERGRAATAADVAHHYRRRTQLRTMLVRIRGRRPPRRPTLQSPARVDAPAAFTADAAFVRRVAVRGRGCGSHRRAAALRCLVDAAQCCSAVDEDPSVATAVPAELLAQLVWLLDDGSGHALERILATTHGNTPSHLEALAWISADEAERALGLVAAPPRRLTAERPTAWWTARRALMYRTSTQVRQDGGSGRAGGGNAWRRGVLARVVALA